MAESLAKASGLNFLSQFVSGGAGLIASILVARSLGPGGAGVYSYLFWLLSLIGTISTLGLPNALTKYIAQYQEVGQRQLARVVAGRIMVFGISVAFASSVIVVVAAMTNVLPLPVSALYVLLVAATVPWTVTGAMLLAIYAGLQRFKTLLTLNLFIYPVSIGLIVVSLWSNRGVVGLLWVNLATSILLTAVGGWLLRQEITLGGHLPADVRREIRSYVVTLSGILFLDLVVWQRSEVFFLAWLSTPDQIAYYSIAYSLVSRLMILLPGAISGVLLPRIAALHGRGAVYDIGDMYHETTRYLAMVTLPIVGAGLALAGPFVTVFYGSEYGSMSAVLRVLLVSGGLAAIVAAGSAVLYGTSHQRIILRLGLVIALINVTLDILVIPRFGAIGAAVANGCAQLVGVGAGTHYLVRRLGLRLPTRSLLKTAGAALVAGLAIATLIGRMSLSPIAALVLGTAGFSGLYLGALAVTQNFDPEDIALARRVREALRRHAKI